jgi:hypothetical protein
MYMGCNWKNHGCNRYHSMWNLKVMHLILMIQVGYRRIGKDSLSPLGSTFQPTQFPLPRLIFFLSAQGGTWSSSQAQQLPASSTTQLSPTSTPIAAPTIGKEKPDAPSFRLLAFLDLEAPQLPLLACYHLPHVTTCPPLPSLSCSTPGEPPFIISSKIILWLHYTKK